MNELIHAHLRRVGGYKYEVTFDEWAGKVVMDEPAPLGGSEGPNASMMISSAVGHCLSASLLFCLEKSRVKAEDVETDVETTLKRNEKGRWRIEGIKVKMRPLVNDVDREKLARCIGLFEDFCIATQSVRQGIKVDVEIEGVGERKEGG
ncbi:MAG: OsmC family protein [Thermoplasmata archaeon]|jgi:uncharacterized OsmC-like protein|nr:OsmC family protein [Thermoplasmata archaeon]